MYLMPSNIYTSIVAFFTFISIISVVIVIFKMNPYDADFGEIAILSFYLSLFFSLFGIFTLIGFYIRKWFLNYEITNEEFNVSVRQGIIIAFYVICILFFYDIDVLTITNIALITFIVFLTELFFWD